MTGNARIKLRGDTAANWTTANPILAAREIGIETDTRKTKQGDGVNAWSALSYSYSDSLIDGKAASADLASHTVGKGLSLIGDSTSGTDAQTSMDARAKSADLSSTTAGKGLALIGDATSGTNAQVSMDARAKIATLAATGGAATIGANDGSSGSLWATVQGFINYLKTTAGASIVGFIAAGANAVARFVQDKLRDTVSVKDFGAKGDGSTDDTTAIQNAINYATTNAVDLFFPAGTYIVQPLTMTSTSYAYMPRLYGSGRTSTILKKKSGAATGAVLTIGASGATNFMSGVCVENMTIDGLSTSASLIGCAVYNLVRSQFRNVIFQNSSTNLAVNGGITSTFQDCVFQSGVYGIALNSFAGSAGSNYPNNFTFERCGIFNNTTYGVNFNNGRHIRFLNCDVEGNGTNGNNNTGGFFVGANIDSEDSGADPIGLVVENSWIEGNTGVGSFIFYSGFNIVRGCNIYVNTNAVYDFYINGGRYIIDGCLFAAPKSPAIYETGSNIAGSYISNCPGLLNANVSVVQSKTQVDFAGLTYTVATLPAPAGLRMRAFVSDATVTASGNFGALPTGGGTNTVPVFFDGSNWRIG